MLKHILCPSRTKRLKGEPAFRTRSSESWNIHDKTEFNTKSCLRPHVLRINAEHFVYSPTKCPPKPAGAVSPTVYTGKPEYRAETVYA